MSYWKLLLIGIAVTGGALAFTLLETMAEQEPVSWLELLMDTIEKSLVIIGAGGVIVLVRRAGQDHREKMALISELEVARVKGADWRARVQAHIAGIGVEIENQFLEWGLTEAEREVGLLLIKGLSHKEIGALRGTAEATVRQQARSIYLKSGQPGKSAFSAYFLEDLLPPSRQKSMPLAAHTRGGFGESEASIAEESVDSSRQSP